MKRLQNKNNYSVGNKLLFINDTLSNLINVYFVIYMFVLYEKWFSMQ